MNQPRNVVLLVTDGHGFHTGDLDWGTEEYRNLRSRLERLELMRRGFTKFDRVMSPAVSTIMSIESILSGLHAAKTHKMHWREWPEWDRLEFTQLSDFLEARDYAVHGFSYLLNSENWMPGVRCYRPELYRDFPSHKRDTHSHEAVLAALRHYFAHAFDGKRPQFLIIHSIFLFDMWEEMEALLTANGMTGENTIWAFTADHYFPKNFGRQWLLGERDRTGIFHHTDLTEYNTRVFLYLKYPGMPAACERHELVAGYDIAPTILELLGCLGQWPGKLDGESLVPLLEGRPSGPRFLRADNVYPFQIGERQGRITAIRHGRYKYVYRPDPASSYIVYRMHEPWGRVLGEEEFYDVEADPEEQQNLIDSTEPAVVAALGACKDYYRASTEEVLAFHRRGLVAYGRRIGFESKLRSGDRGVGCILCVQTCPAEVFVSLLVVLEELLRDVRLVAVARDLGGLSVPARVQLIHYRAEGLMTAEMLRSALLPVGDQGLECILYTSNLPVGDYAGVYDPLAHPVGELKAAQAAAAKLGVPRQYVLGLDLSLHAVGEEGPSMMGAWRAALGRMAVAPLRWVLTRFKARLIKLVRTVEGTGPRISPHLGERIIRRK